MEFPSQFISKKYSILFQPNSDRFRTRSGAVHDERAEEPVHGIACVVKRETPPRMEVETL